MKREEIYKGRIVGLYVDRWSQDGSEVVREVVTHPGGVAIMAEQDDGKILFVRQHRYPMDADLLEFPAGKLDPGEAPIECAARELEEETGMRAAELVPVTEFYTSPGFCTEKLHLFYCNRLLPGRQKLESDEAIEIERYSLQEAIDLVGSRRIVDAKTIVGIYWRARRASEK